MQPNTYKATIEVDGTATVTEDGEWGIRKTISVECDRYGDKLAEATETIKAMVKRLCEQRGWTALWESLKIERLDEAAVRA
jgi:hypothetical protein